MNLMGLLLPLTSVANADPFDGLSGQFIPVTSYEQIMMERDASVERALNASNLIVRTIASSSLETQPTMCAKYQFEYTGTTLFVQCDQHPNIAVHLNGEPTNYPKNDGSIMSVVAKVDGNNITQVFPFTNGTLTVVYRFDNNLFWVQKSLESPYLGLPVIAEGTYKLRP